MHEIRNLVDLFESSCRRMGDAPLFGTRESDAFRWLSYGNVCERLTRMRRL